MGFKLTLPKNIRMNSRLFLYVLGLLFFFCCVLGSCDIGGGCGLFGGVLPSRASVVGAEYGYGGSVYEGMKNAGSDSDGGNSKIVYAHMDGCGYCKKFNPVWDDFVSKMSSMGLSLETKKIEMNEDKEFMTEHGVSGFPTVLGFNNAGDKVMFDGERTVDALVSFAKGLV
tara:strand:+ start:98 stop:607 length:510 start_codon:yes stop_codon:yes gene_type:complete